MRKHDLAEEPPPRELLERLTAALRRGDVLPAVVDRRAELPDETTLLIGEEEPPSYREMQDKIGRLIHGENWRTLALPKSAAQLGAWVQEEVLGEDTFIRSWMIENSDDHYELDVSRARTLLDELELELRGLGRVGERMFILLDIPAVLHSMAVAAGLEAREEAS